MQPAIITLKIKILEGSELRLIWLRSGTLNQSESVFVKEGFSRDEAPDRGSGTRIDIDIL
jgi:hypothetical protein